MFYLCPVTLKYIIMDKKTIIQIVLKVLMYAIGLIAAAYGVSAMTSCAVTRSSDIQGRAVIFTTDTTVINHSGTIQFPRR